MKRTALYSVDKVSGLMLGMAAADALGCRFNDKTPDEIPPLDGEYLLAHPPKNYTNDTQMAISVFEEMAENGGINQASLRGRFLRRFSPWRGYGGGTLEVMERWRGGETAGSIASSLYNGTGNFGDGAAVRSAPISVFFHLEEQDALFEQVHRCSLLTHTHPYGLAGALLQAFSVLLALNDIPVDEWLPRIFKLPIDSAFKIKLGRVVQCLERKASAHESAKEIGNGPQAIEAVPAALYAVVRYPESFNDAVLFAVSMGGDADTISAMVGAVVGARFGLGNIPDSFINRMENDREGNDYIKEMAAIVCGGSGIGGERI